VIGLGGASLAMDSKIVQNPNFRIAAAADIDAEIMDRFGNDFSGMRNPITKPPKLCAEP